MEMLIDFPGGSRVDAHFKISPSPPTSPRGSAPMPFDLFLSSIGTCAGIYVLGFCQQRGCPQKASRSCSASIQPAHGHGRKDRYRNPCPTHLPGEVS